MAHTCTTISGRGERKRKDEERGRLEELGARVELITGTISSQPVGQKKRQTPTDIHTHIIKLIEARYM